MRKVLFAAVLLFAVRAEAQSKGCFYYTADNPLSQICSTGLTNCADHMPCTGNLGTDTALYGTAIGEGCNAEYSLSGCQNALNQSGAQGSALSSCQSQLDNANQQWSVSYNAYRQQLKLISKLKKACGSKCRNVH